MILSFAHLKKRPAQEPAPLQDTPAQEQGAGTRLTLRRPAGIGIMKTALLASANYCEGCPRHWPAGDQDKKNGVPYGRCCREGENATEAKLEAWKSIPLTAMVARCWWHQQGEMDEATHGPMPVNEKNWAIKLKEGQ